MIWPARDLELIYSKKFPDGVVPREYVIPSLPCKLRELSPLPVRLDRRQTWPQPIISFSSTRPSPKSPAHVIETEANQIISQHMNLHLAFDKAERLNVEDTATALLREVRVEVRRCGYQDDRYPCPCAAPATVTDMETGCTFCASHFWEVIL